jgi:hypothetical protein
MLTTDGASPELPAVAELREQLEAACGGAGRSLFVLLDGARIPKLRVMLQQLAVEHRPLFRPSPREDLSHVTPFVARCTPRSDLSTWLALDPTVLEAAVFLVADADLEELHDHLRRFLLVEDPRRGDRYLRFYDPRVLPPFLSASDDSEKRQFFGPISCFLAYDTAGRELCRWNVPVPGAEESPARPPSATAKFRLRAEHEAAFVRDAMDRYDRRCVAYLRGRYPERLREKPDDEIRAVVDRAKALGGAFGCRAGRDTTVLAELLVIGLDEDSRQRLQGFPVEDRSAALPRLRDWLLLEGRS